MRLLDVWFVEANTVYKQVPYHVVSGWVQQGRLGPTDRVRPVGSADWQAVSEVALLAVYQPPPEPDRIDDAVEAMEPVQLDFGWKRRSGDEDDDPDMIPLIDISLVLLIFFMMTAVVSALSPIAVPDSLHGPEVQDDPEVYWIGIDYDPKNRQPSYTLGRGNDPPTPEDSDLPSDDALIGRINERMQQQQTPPEFRIAAHRDLPAKYTQRLLSKLEAKRKDWGIRNITYEVNERPQ